MSDYINWLGQKNKDGKTNKQILTDCSSIEAGNIAWQAALQSQWQPIETAPLNQVIIVLTKDNIVGWAELFEYYAKDNYLLWQPLPPPPKTGE